LDKYNSTIEADGEIIGNGYLNLTTKQNAVLFLIN